MLPFLILLFLALQAADVALTVKVLRQGGRELNPVARWLMGRFGTVGGLLAMKAAGLALIFGLIALLPEMWAVGFLMVVSAGYTVIVVHNYRQIKS